MKNNNSNEQRNETRKLLHNDFKIDTYLENFYEREIPMIIELQCLNKINKYFQTAT